MMNDKAAQEKAGIAAWITFNGLHEIMEQGLWAVVGDPPLSLVHGSTGEEKLQVLSSIASYKQVIHRAIDLVHVPFTM